MSLCKDACLFLLEKNTNEENTLQFNEFPSNNAFSRDYDFKPAVVQALTWY